MRHTEDERAGDQFRFPLIDFAVQLDGTVKRWGSVQIPLDRLPRG